jgi:hypothetical protein
MRKTSLSVALIATLALSNAGCNDAVKPDDTAQPTGKPSFVHHPEPPAKDLVAPFKALGCPKESYSSGIKPCGALEKFGCTSINLLEGEYAGVFTAFQPSYPIAMCQIVANGRPPLAEGEYVSSGGGLLQQYTRYIIAKDGKFALLKNKADFQHLFLPIDDGFEALAYARIMTPYMAAYGFQYNSNETYFVKSIEDSHAKPAGDGYDVLMYEHSIFGCGKHPTYAVKLHVSKDGKITELGSKTKISEGKMEMCVD